MGGSSLCPEVLKETFGRIDGHPDLVVLDSTDPAQIRAFETKVDLARTLFIVSSKSGSTLEPNIFKQYFCERVRTIVDADRMGSRFIAITDPGSKLQQVAEAEEFCRVFFGLPSIGGRYSALSDFGMVPAAIMGLDVARLLRGAEEMAHACASCVPVEENPGAVLGIIMGVLARNGRDKVTLIASPGLHDLGAWLEQLLAESTGKAGTGLIPVDREPLGAPEVYGTDRLFVYLRLAPAPDARQDAQVAGLERAGHPVVKVTGQVAWAAKVIARALRQAGLADLLGVTGGVNVQAEAVKKLDLLANQAFIDAFREMGLVCAVVSEEMEGPYLLAEDCERAGYALFIDPLDGSSNLDVNGSVGSIFSIHRRQRPGLRSDESELLQPGSAQVAAGYVLYGPSTVLAYTAGHGAAGFTLDPSIGEFLLSHESLHVPARGRTYSVNERRSWSWPPAIRKFIDALKERDQATGRPYSARYAGALVADLHRTLLEGGIYLYPAETAEGGKPTGKLRLMYEAAPLAFVTEQAGGRASTGSERILDITPTSIHQRVPLVIGSPEEVSLVEALVRETSS